VINVYSKVWVKSSVLKYPSVCLETRAFLTYLRWVARVAQSIRFPLQPKPFPFHSQKSFEPVVLKRKPLGSLREEFLISGELGGKAAEKKP